MILFVELQTTGGYPKIANVVSADFLLVGAQLAAPELGLPAGGEDEAY